MVAAMMMRYGVDPARVVELSRQLGRAEATIRIVRDHLRRQTDAEAARQLALDTIRRLDMEDDE